MFPDKKNFGAQSFTKSAKCLPPFPYFTLPRGDTFNKTRRAARTFFFISKKPARRERAPNLTDQPFEFGCDWNAPSPDFCCSLWFLRFLSGFRWTRKVIRAAQHWRGNLFLGPCAAIRRSGRGAPAPTRCSRGISYTPQGRPTLSLRHAAAVTRARRDQRRLSDRVSRTPTSGPYLAATFGEDGHLPIFS